MKPLFFAGAALAALVATSAPAQPGGEGRMAQPQTRADVQARVQARFAKADMNRDGFVTQDEVRARAEARRERRGERRDGRRGKVFERLDANNDGMLSRAEFEAPRMARGGGERRLSHRGGGGGGMMGGRFFAAMDRDRDGRVALAEAQGAALERFDRVDSNRDGTVTPAERQAARAARMERP